MGGKCPGSHRIAVTHLLPCEVKRLSHIHPGVHPDIRLRRPKSGRMRRLADYSGMSLIHALPISLSLVGAFSTLVASLNFSFALVTSTRSNGSSSVLTQLQSLVGKLIALASSKGIHVLPCIPVHHGRPRRGFLTEFLPPCRRAGSVQGNAGRVDSLPVNALNGILSRIAAQAVGLLAINSRAASKTSSISLAASLTIPELLVVS